jgi:uncharacterized protein YdiU (UPF0061 family)
MNTDNMSILGLTIDYGPYGWVDNFDPGWTPNTTDAAGHRYCFGRQPEIARWNLERLADALAGLVPDPGLLEAGLSHYDAVYAEEFSKAFAGKFGFRTWCEDDSDLVNDVFELMQRAEVDMTEFFRSLAKLDIDAPDLEVLREAFYREDLYNQLKTGFSRWLERYAARLRQDAETTQTRITRMNRLNPRFVLRNYLAQQAIEAAEQGDAGLIHELLDVLRRPYEEQAGRQAFSARRPDWARHKAGCSMLSCSS